MRGCFMAAMVLLAGACSAAAAPPPQVAFLNHSFAVLDTETADAVAHSDYLRGFGVFEMRTTVANGGETWTGRYLAGRQTYLEFFGPKDLQDAVEGTTGLAVSPDRPGGLATLEARLTALGVTKLDTDRRTRKYGDDQVPWFDGVSLPGDPKSLSVWAMEYLESFFADPRAGKEAADFPGDISRERYQSDAYAGRLMRDITEIEIAATDEDIASARTLLAAAGFHLTEEGGRLIARDRDTTITLDAVALAQIGMRRIGFVLNQPAQDRHIERLGHSTLIVGPGLSAVWRFDPRP